jgi:hypothetical protein
MEKPHESFAQENGVVSDYDPLACRRSCLVGQVRAGTSQWREVARQVRNVELVEALGAIEVLQRMLAEVAKTQVGEHLVGQDCVRRV